MYVFDTAGGRVATISRLSNPAVVPAVQPAVPFGQKALSGIFGADKEVKHQRARDGADGPKTPSGRHLLATDTSDGGGKGGAGEMLVSKAPAVLERPRGFNSLHKCDRHLFLFLDEVPTIIILTFGAGGSVPCEGCLIAG